MEGDFPVRTGGEWVDMPNRHGEAMPLLRMSVAIARHLGLPKFLEIIHAPVNSEISVRILLTWFLVIGFIAGLGTRVLASHNPEPVSSHEHHECSGHDHGPADQGHTHDDTCPPDHHHHCGTCLHHLPLGLDQDVFHRLTVPEFSRSKVRHESEWPPDGPFQTLDKPPLI
jgi:hypothetical protein